jgi:glycosyltransferase involved in cell wall biosynthesis
MNIQAWMKRENSGLARTTLELAKYTEMAGHSVCIKEPGDGAVRWGVAKDPDLHTIHSQLNPDAYYDRKPKFMWMHGEPLSSVGNGVSMKAICDLSSKIDAFLCMRKDEWPIWNSIKRTYLVDKGIDLDFYCPAPGTEKLEGEPAILYLENWRGSRNPLYLCMAMEKIQQKLPKAKLHLYNCRDPKMKETFQSLIKNNKWWTFIKGLNGPVDIKDVNQLYNRADIVVSCLFPLYARSIEAFGAGKAFIGPGYKEHDYPFQCDLSPDSIADTIIRCWENYDQINYREWAILHHNVENTVKQSLDAYGRYL